MTKIEKFPLNNSRRSRVSTLAMLCLSATVAPACYATQAEVDEFAAVEQSLKNNGARPEVAVMRGQIEARLATDPEELLQPRGFGASRTTKRMNINARGLVKNVDFLSGHEDTLVDTKDEIRLGRTPDDLPPPAGEPRVDVDRNKGYIAITSGELPVKRNPGLGDLPEQAYSANARKHFRDLGLDDSEVELQVETLGMREMGSDPRDTPRAIEKIEKIVYANRAVNGLRVIGERVIFCYHLNAKLREILGKWTPIDYRKSQFEPFISSREDVMERLSEKMTEWVPGPEHIQSDIELEPVYEIVQDPSNEEYYLDMKANVRFRAGRNEGETVPRSELIDL